MDTALPAVLGALGAVALVAVCAVVLVRARAQERRTRTELEQARWETAALHARLDALTARLDRPGGHDHAGGSAYVITDAGRTADVDPDRTTVPDRVVLSATLGEPLVRAVSLGHGLRRALSAESRHRIRFEVRRETRRSRKQRRREMKDAWRRERSAAAEPTQAA